MKCERICLFLLFIFCGVGNSVEAASLATNSRIHWRTLLSYNNWSDENPAVMRIPDGYFVAGTSSYMADKTYLRKVILWKLDNSGRELWVKDINLPSWQTGKPFTAERCFSLQDEPTLFLVSASTLRAWLLRFDNSGSVVFSKEFSSQQVFDVQGLVKTNDGLLLYGSAHKIIYQKEPNSDACVTKLDPNGNEIWRREYDKGKMEWGMGLALLKNGDFILSADSGIYNKFGAGPSEVWIVKCDPSGNILRETTFEGRHPTVAVNGDMTAVVFNKENFPQQDISVIGLDSELKTLWRIDSLFGKTGGLGMLKTIVNKRGNFVLAGSKFDTTALWEISNDGNCLGEIKIEGAEHCVRFDSLFQASTGYLIAGAVFKIPEMPRTSDGPRDKKMRRDNMDIFVAEVADFTK